MEQKDPVIHFAHLCDTAFFSREGKLNIIGMFKIIGVRKLPSLHPKLSIALSCALHEPSKMKIQILKKETGETIAKLEADLNHKDEKTKEVVFVSDFNNVKFEEEGLYHTEIWMNHQLVETIPFEVRLAKEKQ